ncbi:MAG: ATP-binding cassette domain-containing protein [Spirochaetales bacterium]|nr:ATP-binding cassette domain-containing protein [Spirochaetales bacterium]
MGRNAVIVQSLFFSYPDSPQELFSNVDFHLTPGWTGMVGTNGVGKSTLLRLIAGELSPQSGTIATSGPVELLRQRTDTVPDGLDELLWAGEAGRIRSILGVGDDWPWRWESLSHGERKRAQIAVALWRESPILLLDEPGNHLDRASRGLITAALERYEGIGVLVSHDRELLDALCSACLFVRGPAAVHLRPGGVSDGLAEEDRERTAAQRAARDLKREEDRLREEYQRRREEASRQRHKRSKRALDRGDSDGRARIGLAILTGKDGQAGRFQSQLDGRLRDIGRRRAHADAAAGAAAERIKRGITVAGAKSRRDTLLSTPETRIALGDERRLTVPELTVSGSDRIGVAGPNGSGKSTLLAYLLSRVGVSADVPSFGEGSMVGSSPVLYMPQELTTEIGGELAAKLRSLAPAIRGAVLSRFSRLGSDPEGLLHSAMLSPGEARKLMLASALESEPELIVLDEPTNHLDLDAIRLLEDALAGYHGALLLVSHDERFLSAVCSIRWEISRSSTGRDTTVRVIGTA